MGAFVKGSRGTHALITIGTIDWREMIIFYHRYRSPITVIKVTARNLKSDTVFRHQEHPVPAITIPTIPP